MLKFILLLFCFCHFGNALALMAEADKNLIEIGMTFSGDQIKLHGYKDEFSTIAVIVRGFKEDYSVRKKEKDNMIWLNKSFVELSNVYNYYSVYMAEKLEDSSIGYLLSNYEIGIKNIDLNAVYLSSGDINKDDYKEAFVRFKESLNLYSEHVGSIKYSDDMRLFEVNIEFPSTVKPGRYSIAVLQITNNVVNKVVVIPFVVKSAGFDKFIGQFSHENKVIYSLFAVVIAILTSTISYFILKNVRIRFGEE